MLNDNKSKMKVENLYFPKLLLPGQILEAVRRVHTVGQNAYSLHRTDRKCPLPLLPPHTQRILEFRTLCVICTQLTHKNHQAVSW